MKKTREKFEVAGSITVDAGIVQIGDPCYQYGSQEDWMAFLHQNKMLDNNSPDITQVPHTKICPDYGLKAVVVSSGFGDGVYDVLVKRCSKTGMVKELKVKFF